MDNRLKEYMLNNFCYKSLKQVGFWGDIKPNEYEKQAARVCTFFNLQSIYEYSSMLPSYISQSETTITGKMPDKIDKDGNLIHGGGFHLDITRTVFTCPICTCEQDAEDHAAYNKHPEHANIKCKGCKRKLLLTTGIGGRLSIEEVIN